jgi:hypothetical protein
MSIRKVFGEKADLIVAAIAASLAVQDAMYSLLLVERRRQVGGECGRIRGRNWPTNLPRARPRRNGLQVAGTARSDHLRANDLRRYRLGQSMPSRCIPESCLGPLRPGDDSELLRQSTSSYEEIQN